MATERSLALKKISDDVERLRGQVQMCLPRHITLDKFMRVTMTAVLGEPDILLADRRSLLQSCIEAAQDGLLPDGREGALVVYSTKQADGSYRKMVQWQPMVGGLIKLARQSGELKYIGASLVYSVDEFDLWVDDSGQHMKHKPALTEEHGAPRLVYAQALLIDGTHFVETILWSEVEKFRALSKAKAAGTPWAQWTDQMAMVRAIKRLCKRLPMSTEAQDAINRSNEREASELGMETGGAQSRTTLENLNAIFGGDQLDTKPAQPPLTPEHERAKAQAEPEGSHGLQGNQDVKPATAALPNDPSPTLDLPIGGAQPSEADLLRMDRERTEQRARAATATSPTTKAKEQK